MNQAQDYDSYRKPITSTFFYFFSVTHATGCAGTRHVTAGHCAPLRALGVDVKVESSSSAKRLTYFETLAMARV